jgi:hypothetical protein
MQGHMNVKFCWNVTPCRLQGQAVHLFDPTDKSKEGKPRTDIGKYSFVNRTIKNWDQLPKEELRTFPC